MSTGLQTGQSDKAPSPPGQPSLEEIVAGLNPDASDPNFRWPPLPDHTTLPDHDDAVENFLEHPRSMLLTETIQPVLRARHPDGQYAIGSNSGIYWKITNQPLEGCKAPDWYCIPDVHSSEVDGVPRRSYVMWREGIPPLVIIEFASGDGSEERDRTPKHGKFWVYEKGIRTSFYVIQDRDDTLSVFVLDPVTRTFQRLEPNAHGRYPIKTLGVELGMWHGTYMNITQNWLRWWDEQGNLLPTSEERAEQERQRAEQESQRAEQERQRAERERQRAERLAEQLRKLGIQPENGQ